MKTLLCTLLLAACGAASAKADIVITLDNPVQAASPGQTIQFFGTITDTDPSGSDAEYLNADDLNLGGVPDLTTTDLFFTNVPISLSPGGSSGDIELFDVSVGSPFSGAFQTYSGTYTLFGGQDGGAFTASDNLAQANFGVIVTPEPSSISLLLGVLMALALIPRKART